MRMLLADADNKSVFLGKSAHLYGCADFFYSVTYLFKYDAKRKHIIFYAALDFFLSGVYSDFQRCSEW